jgi:hypothetical protein
VWAISANPAILVSATGAILVATVIRISAVAKIPRSTRVSTATFAATARLLIVARLPAIWALGLGDATLGALGNVEVCEEVLRARIGFDRFRLTKV